MSHEMTNCNFRHLDASNAMLSSKFSSIFEPADARHGATHSWTTKLHCVSCRNSIEFLLHTLGMCPIRSCTDKEPLISRYSTKFKKCSC